MKIAGAQSLLDNAYLFIVCALLKFWTDSAVACDYRYRQMQLLHKGTVQDLNMINEM